MEPANPDSPIARFVRNADLRNCGATRVVLVDGRSGSGKTFYAAMFAQALDATVVHMDDLYPGWDGLDAGIEILARDILLPLSIARPVRYHRWDWANDRWGDEVDIGVPEMLIVEGTGACSAATLPFSVLSVWVDAPDADRYRRAMERDGRVYAENWDRWAAQENAHFAREDTRHECSHEIDGLRDWVNDP